MARSLDFGCLALTLIAMTVCGEQSLTGHTMKPETYVIKPYKLITARQKERGLMLRLKKPSTSSVPDHRMDAAEWLDSLLQGVYHPLDDKGRVVEDVPETRFGVQHSERRPSASGSKKRLNLKGPSEFDRQFVFRPPNMGTLRLEQPVSLQRPLAPAAVFRHRDNFHSARRPPRLRHQRPAFKDNFNAPLNHRPKSQQANNFNSQSYDNQHANNCQQDNMNSQPQQYNNQRPNNQQQNYGNQRPSSYQEQYEVQIYSNQQSNSNNQQQDGYQPDDNQQDGYQPENNQQNGYQPENNQQNGYQPENNQQNGYLPDYNQQDTPQEQDYNNQQNDFQQEYQQPDVANQNNGIPNDPYSSQQDPYSPPATNDNYASVNDDNYNQQTNTQNRPPKRQYVFNVDVYVNQKRQRRNHALRSLSERYTLRQPYRPVKK